MQLDSSWDAEEQSRRAIFMDHMYQCSGRSDVDHPMHGGKSFVYTKLVKQCVINGLIACNLLKI
jgi:hypothetical protein